MIRFLYALILLTLTSCGGFQMPEYETSDVSQLKVIEVLPGDGENVAWNAAVVMKFSMALNPESVDERSLVIVSDDGENSARLIDDILDGDLMGMDGSYEYNDVGDEVTFSPEGGFPSAGGYLLVATQRVVATNMTKLSQHPSIAGEPFVSSFFISEDGSGGASGGAGGNGDVSIAANRNRPNVLVLNEVLYDVTGSDTDGDVFIELYGDAGGDMTGYNLIFVNGDDGVIKDTIALPEGAMIPDDGIYLIADAKTGQSGVSDVYGADYIVNFDPQNGPDCIQLTGEGGQLIDALGYGEGIVITAENGIACFEGIAAPKVSSGMSLSRIEGLDSDDNLLDFEILSIPSPGVL